MKTDLSNATFIIPIRIESDDRLRNVVTSIAFLVENFDTNIIVKEVDEESVFQTEVLPIFEEILQVDLWKNFHHIFERSEEPLFHRQRVLNEMIAECDTDIVVNYDCDVILPIQSYKLAYNGIMDGIYDVVYPYGSGMYQKQVAATDDICSKFLEKINYEYLDAVSIFIHQILVGHNSSNVEFILKVVWRMKILKHTHQKIRKGSLDLIN